MRRILSKAIPLIDFILMPLTFLSSRWLFMIRKIGVHKMKLARKIFKMVGVFPIIDHYYEPLFNPKYFKRSNSKNRLLPGIDLNIEKQLKLLNQFKYNIELIKIPLKKEEAKWPHFYHHNGNFAVADAEYLYNIVRYFKPQKIVEIGSGYSTLMAAAAIEQNLIDDKNYQCEHICIEPFEMSWLEETGVKIIRNKAEDIDINYFSKLETSDILFIDSSHIIRPQGDVLFELLHILPILNSGVLVHIHDVFTPKDYPYEWLFENVWFWNEQYLLEAFLTFNCSYEIIGALNYLYNNYFKELSDKCPLLNKKPQVEPSSFWLIKK